MSDFMISSSTGQGPVGPINRASGYSQNLAPREASAKADIAAQRGDDTVEVSEHAKWMERLRQLPAVRIDKVNQVRQAIADGSYETDDRLNAAIDQLEHDLGL